MLPTSMKARVYIAITLLAGLLSLSLGLFHGQWTEPSRYVCYLALALLASGMKVSLPGVHGTMSVVFVFILVGVRELTLAQTLLMGVLGTAVQCYWKPKTWPKPVQVAFNVASMASATAGTYYLFHSRVSQFVADNQLLILVASGATFFVLNTVPVACVISLTEQKPLRKVWSECYFWSFPYYLLGAAIAGIVELIDKKASWQPSLLILPVVYLIFRSYRLYLARLEFERMKVHPLVGAEILERVQFPYPVVPIVRAHHERWDGNGYPCGLRGDEIPTGARILAVVDCLDGLASDRQYRPALSLEKAMEQVIGEAGKSFDPKVVEVLQSRYREFELLANIKGSEQARLTKNIKVESAAPPGAGFEKSDIVPINPGSSSIDFLASIAAARHEVQTLFEITRELGNSLSLDETLSMLAARLKHLVPYDSIAIYSVRNIQLVPEHVSGDNFRLLSSLRIPIGEGVSGWVAANRKPIVNGNLATESERLNDPTNGHSLRSVLAVPLEGVDGVVGVLALYRTEADAFTRDHLRILLAISSKIALSFENALKYRQVERTATTDYLTSLPNARSLFIHLDSELARCRRHQMSVAVLVCDLDGFKQINDRFGHLQGNRDR